MKTPREILLGQHQNAAPKLDAIRCEVLAELNHRDTKAQSLFSGLVSWCLGGSNKLWLELIWPCRRIWTGLAAIWILIFIVNFSLGDSSPTGVMRVSSPETMMTFQQQERLLAELDEPGELRIITESPKKFMPRPRSERVEILAT